MFLSALAAWALARHVTGDPIAAAVAGMVYAFLPWRMEQIPHLQYQWGAFLCLILLFLLRYLEDGPAPGSRSFGVAFAWNALANVHFAVFSGFLVAVTLALVRPATGRPATGGASGGRSAAAAVDRVPFLPVRGGLPRAEKLYGFRRYPRRDRALLRAAGPISCRRARATASGDR